MRLAIWSGTLHLVMERKAYPEDCWFAFSCSPIQDESRAIAGMFPTQRLRKMVRGRD